VFYKTKGVIVNKRAASGVRQSNKPQATVRQSKRSKTVAKLVAALCKSDVECFWRRPWLLEESFAFALALTL
jgi:hypothetical protein